MLKRIVIPGRFSLLFNFILWFFIVSQLLRLLFFVWQYDQVSWNPINFLRTLLTGLFFDIGTITYVSLTAVIYYAIVPDKWIGSLADRILVWFFTTLTLLVLIFTFFAEITFWDEFRTRLTS